MSKTIITITVEGEIIPTDKISVVTDVVEDQEVTPADNTTAQAATPAEDVVTPTTPSDEEMTPPAPAV